MSVNSLIFNPPTRTLKTWSFNLLPLHVGQVCSAINEAYHSLDHDEVVSSNLLSINVFTPSIGLVVLETFPLLDIISYVIGLLEPSKIIFNSFLEKSFNGLSKSILYVLHKIKNLCHSIRSVPTDVLKYLIPP